MNSYVYKVRLRKELKLCLLVHKARSGDIECVYIFTLSLIVLFSKFPPDKHIHTTVLCICIYFLFLFVHLFLWLNPT